MREIIVLAVLIGGFIMAMSDKPENPIWAWLMIFIAPGIVWYAL